MARGIADTERAITKIFDGQFTTKELGKAWSGAARQGWAGRDSVRRGEVGLDLTGPGMAWLGKAR